MDENTTLLERRLGSVKHGETDANSWVEEGDGLAATARSIRINWLRTKKKIKIGSPEFLRRGEVAALTGNPRASVLLMGYAVEMYLKAGLAKWLKHCPESLFLADIRRYSHHYRKLADDLEIDASIAPRELLDFLSKAVMLEARYPASPRRNETPIDAINRRTTELWSDAKFKAISLLVRRLRTHVVQMNSDRLKPSYTKSFGMPLEGYIVMRVGGHLPSRVTVRPPRGAEWGSDEVGDLLESIASIKVQQHWRQCALYLHCSGKGSRMIKSKST